MLIIRKRDNVNEMPRYILIAVIVLVVLAGGWYVYSGKQSSIMPYTQNSSQGSSAGDKISGKFADLLNAGKSMECTFSGETDGYKTSGTVFVAGKNMRGDFNSESKGKMMDSHMIQNGEKIYSWTTEPKQGMMMKITKEDQARNQEEADSAANKPLDVDKNYDYNCKGWSGDQSKFQPPSDIEFQDLSVMMEKATGGVGKDAGLSCSACDNLEGDAKASCQQALGC